MAEGGPRLIDKEKKERQQDHEFKTIVDNTALQNLTLESEIRMILVGKIGVGKSSTGNTITNSSTFIADASADSVTKQCKHVSTMLKNRRITVIDTPGLFDTTEQNSTQHVRDEIKSCMRLGAPGIHAIIFILSAAMRFSEEDKRCFEEFCSIFGNNFFEYAVVVFTWADRLTNENKSLDQYIGGNAVLKGFLKKCGNRTISINNFNPTPLENERQLNHLFDAVMLMNKANNYKYYTDELFREAEMEMQRREQKLREQNEKKKQEDLLKIRKSLEKQYKRDLKQIEKRFNKEKQEILDRFEYMGRHTARRDEERQRNERIQIENSGVCTLM